MQWKELTVGLKKKRKKTTGIKGEKKNNERDPLKGPLRVTQRKSGRTATTVRN